MRQTPRQFVIILLIKGRTQSSSEVVIMNSIFVAVCLVGIVVGQSASPEPVAKPTAKAAIVDIVATAKPPTAAQQTKKPTEAPKKGCHPLCNTPWETCVRLANCQGNDCFKCAQTASIVLPVAKPQKTIDVRSQITKPVIVPALLPALEQLMATQAKTPSNSLFGSADPFQNMMFGSMLMDGGMGFF